MTSHFGGAGGGCGGGGGHSLSGSYSRQAANVSGMGLGVGNSSSFSPLRSFSGRVMSPAGILHSSPGVALMTSK